MSKVRLISKSREDLLKLLLKDNRISSIVLLNNEIPESIVINDDGSVTFGRTPKHWWNKIFEITQLCLLQICVLKCLMHFHGIYQKTVIYHEF